MDRLRLIAALIAGAFALGSVGAMAADGDSPAYKMGMASQRQHDLDLHAAQMPLIQCRISGVPVRCPSESTAAESKALKDDAAKARAAYASMTPEERAMYKNGMKAQRQMDLEAQPIATTPNGTLLIGNFPNQEPVERLLSQ